MGTGTIQAPRIYQCFDMYCEPIGSPANSADEAVQSAIYKLNSDRENAIKGGLPEQLAAKEVKTWEDLEKFSVSVASYVLQWEMGWKAVPPTHPTGLANQP